MKYKLYVILVSILFLIGCTTGQVIKEIDKEPEQSEKITETQIQEPKEEKPSCSDECSTDSCDGFSYISCLSGKDVCKYKQNKGLVKGKCGVECIQDSDCGSNQNCESSKCKTREIYLSLKELYVAKNPIGHNVRLHGIGLKLHAVSSEDFFLFTDDERVMNNPSYIAYYGAEYDIVVYNNPKSYVQQKIININGTVVNCERKEDGKYCINAESIEIVDEFVNA